MSAESQDRHVLDELLEQSLKRGREDGRTGEGRIGQPRNGLAERSLDAALSGSSRQPAAGAQGSARALAQAERPRAATSADDGRQRRWEDLPAAEELEVPEVRAPAPRPAGTMLSEAGEIESEEVAAPRLWRRPERDQGFPSRPSDEVQVGRGPLALHLGRGAIEERLGELSARIEELQGRLRRQRERNGELRQAIRELKEELATQASALREAQAQEQRAKQEAEALRAQLAPARARARELEGELESERLRRTRAELELERLRGSLTTLGPLLSGIERATEAVRAADSQGAEGAGAGEHQARRQGASLQGPHPERHERAAEREPAGEHRPGAGARQDAGERPAGRQEDPLAGVARLDLRHGRPASATEARGKAERAGSASAHGASGGGIVRVIADAVDYWRGPGPRPAR